MLKHNCGCITVYPSHTDEDPRPQMSLGLAQAVGSMTFGADGIELTRSRVNPDNQNSAGERASTVHAPPKAQTPIIAQA
jgi:hypothetical protein